MLSASSGKNIYIFCNRNTVVKIYAVCFLSMLICSNETRKNVFYCYVKEFVLLFVCGCSIITCKRADMKKQNGQRPDRVKQQRFRHMAMQCVYFAVAASLLVCAFWSPARATDRQYERKAAFMCKVLQFIDWPEAACSAEDTTITIGILGRDPFGAAFVPFAGKTVRGRRLVVCSVSSPDEAVPCEMLFVAASEQHRLNAVMASLKDSGALTVSDLPDFIAQGGMLYLYEEKDAVRLEINHAAAKRAGFKISSKLLEMARVVR